MERGDDMLYNILLTIQEILIKVSFSTNLHVLYEIVYAFFNYLKRLPLLPSYTETIDCLKSTRFTSYRSCDDPVSVSNFLSVVPNLEHSSSFVHKVSIKFVQKWLNESPPFSLTPLLTQLTRRNKLPLQTFKLPKAITRLCRWKFSTKCSPKRLDPADKRNTVSQHRHA